MWRKLTNRDICGWGQFWAAFICDASETAYTSFIYIRTTNTKTATIVVAKSSITSLKSLTILKLELRAAVFGCKLLHHTRRALQKIGWNPKKVFGWTDATIVLCWINETQMSGTPLFAIECLKHWKFWNQSTGVMNEVRKNPADAATRRPDAMTLKNSWHWPRRLSEFLVSDQPKLTNVGAEKKRKLELSIGRNWSNHLWTRQSILKGSAVYRNAFVFSAILPFLHIHSRSTQKMAVRIIQLHWQIDATPFWCYYELRALNAGNSVAKMSHLHRLNPFVDDGVIKSGSRLTQNKDLTEDQRNQIVILKKSWLAKLI